MTWKTCPNKATHTETNQRIQSEFAASQIEGHAPNELHPKTAVNPYSWTDNVLLLL